MSNCPYCAIIATGVVRHDMAWIDIEDALRMHGIYGLWCPVCAEKYDAEQDADTELLPDARA